MHQESFDLSIEQLATAIDCEGYIGINKTSRPNGYKQWSAKIGLAMIHPFIPQQFHKRFGSSYRIENNPKGNYPVHKWEMNGNKQIEFVLKSLFPHLVVKKTQAQNVLDFLAAFQSMPKGTKDKTVLDSFWIKGKNLNSCPSFTNDRITPNGE